MASAVQISGAFLVAGVGLLGGLRSDARVVENRRAAADTAWRDHLAYLTNGGGIWIASNASYRTAENREPPAYGQRYWMGLGGTVQHGCLWGEYAEQKPVFWQFFTAWDPAKQQLLVHQASPDGTVGLGYETPSSGIAEQTFTRSNGASWKSRHESTRVRPDTLVTKSFELVNGTWEPRRTYTWIRQHSDVRAPCEAAAQLAADLRLSPEQRGATAMQLWGTTRATRDVDILIEATVANARRVLRALSSLGFGFAKELLAQEIVKRPVTVIGDTPNVDILTIAWTVSYADARRKAEVFDVEGVKIPTASIEDLIASKRTGRLQDAADIEILEEIRRLRGS